MRGPIDEMIDARQTGAEPPAADARKAVAEAAPKKPPGGKALLRLLQLLESRGFEESAAEVIDAAVHDEARDELRSRLKQFTAAPDAKVDEGGRA